MIFMAHSGIRYLVLLLAVVCAVYAIVGWATGRPYDRAMRGIASAFAGVIHLQILVGLAVIFTSGFYPALMGHITMMIAAAAVAQIPASVMRRRPEEKRTYAPHAVSALVALALIAGGVMAIGRPLIGTGG